jgi:hypothetical protein
MAKGWEPGDGMNELLKAFRALSLSCLPGTLYSIPTDTH